MGSGETRSASNMTKRIIGPRPVSTPSDLRSASLGSRALPEDLLRAASVRLGVMSVLFAVLWFLGTAMGLIADHVLFPDDKALLLPDLRDAIATISIVVSLALYRYTRKPNRNPKSCSTSDCGTWYTALALGLRLTRGLRPNYLLRRSRGLGCGADYAAIIPLREENADGTVAVSMNPSAC